MERRVGAGLERADLDNLGVVRLHQLHERLQSLQRRRQAEQKKGPSEARSLHIAAPTHCAAHTCPNTSRTQRIPKCPLLRREMLPTGHVPGADGAVGVALMSQTQTAASLLALARRPTADRLHESPYLCLHIAPGDESPARPREPPRDRPLLIMAFEAHVRAALIVGQRLGGLFGQVKQQHVAADALGSNDKRVLRHVACTACGPADKSNISRAYTGSSRPIDFAIVTYALDDFNFTGNPPEATCLTSELAIM